MCQIFAIGWKTPKLTRAPAASPPCSLGCELCRAVCTGRAAECSEWSGNAWSCSPARSPVQTQLDLDAGSKHPLCYYFQVSQKHFAKCVKSCFREAGVPRGSSALVFSFLLLWPGVLSLCAVCTAHPSLSIRNSSWQSGSCQGAPRGQPGGSQTPRCSLVVGGPNIPKPVA